MSGPARYCLVVLLLLLTVPLVPLSAQRGRGGPGLGLNGIGPRLGENVQLALDLRADLNLTPDQVGALEELQLGIAEDVAPLEARIREVRTRVFTGETGAAPAVGELDRLLADYQTAADPYRVRIAEILTTDQHLLLQSAMFDTRPGVGWGYGTRSLGAPGGDPATGVLPRAGYYGRGLGRGYGGGWGRGRGWGGRGAGYGRGLGYGRGAGYGRGGWGYNRIPPRWGWGG